MPLLFLDFHSAAANAKDSPPSGNEATAAALGLFQGWNQMPRVNAARAALRTSVLWLALAYVGKKRGDRSLVKPGSISVELTITGKVAGVKVNESIAGELNLGKPTEAADYQAADPNELLALVLRAVGDQTRQIEVLEAIHKQFADNKATLPLIPKVEVERVELWRKRFTQSSMKPKAGNLTFSPRPVSEAA